MTVKVIDASAAAALLFAEPTGDEVAGWLVGAYLVAPVLLPFELASVCLKKVRRYPSQREALHRALELYRRLGVQEVEPDLAETISLAEECELSVYDAAYLWLARQLDAELVTLDTELARAAARVVK